MQIVPYHSILVVGLDSEDGIGLGLRVICLQILSSVDELKKYDMDVVVRLTDDHIYANRIFD